MKLPRSSVERFKSFAGCLYGLRRAFRVGDINSVLKAFEWVPVGAEQSIEEADVVCGHDIHQQSQIWIRRISQLNIDVDQKRPAYCGRVPAVDPNLAIGPTQA